MKKLKILCVIERSSWDGAKEQTYLFVREMSKHHDVELAINEKFTRMSEMSKGIAKVHFFEKYSNVDMRLNVNNYIRLLKIINENLYDVIITQSSLSMHYLRIIKPWIKKETKIVTVKRGDTLPNFMSKHLKYSVADEIVLVSQYVKKQLEERSFFTDRLHVIESGVDLSRFFPDNTHSLALRQELGLHANDKVFINVSNWDLYRKRQHIILNAFAKLKHRNCKLILAGVGTNGQEALDKVSELGLSGRVYCLGFRNDIPALLNASDFFVMSSRSEGIAGALLQAMACGKPVLSTNAGGIREYLVDGVNGYGAAIEDIDDFEKKFVALPDLPEPIIKKLSEESIKTAKRYSLEHNIQQWLTLIEQIYNRPGTNDVQDQLLNN